MHAQRGDDTWCVRCTARHATHKFLLIKERARAPCASRVCKTTKALACEMRSSENGTMRARGACLLAVGHQFWDVRISGGAYAGLAKRCDKR